MTTPWPPQPPVQASDPGRLWNGQVVARDVVEMPVGGSFSVDLDQAPRAIRELEDARDQLRALLVDVRRLGRIDPEVDDEVSRDAATVFGAVADGGTGSLALAVDAGIRRLDLLIEAVRSELAAYQTGDGAAGAAFRDRAV